MAKPVYQQIAACMDTNGRGPVSIGCDPNAGHEDGSDCEGPWYITAGYPPAADSYCYYRTREDARYVVREAREFARRGA